MNTNQLWQAVLGELEVSLSKANFTTWLKNTFILDAQTDTIVVGVPNTFTKTWLENKYHPKILRALQSSSENNIINVKYKVSPVKNAVNRDLNKEGAVDDKTKEEADQTAVLKKAQEVGLNPRYTFENFVVGKKNELAHAAAQAVSEKIGTVYNPLFVYGDVGLGKTHLMQAIGNQVIRGSLDKRVLYVPCETFTTEFINSISKGTVDGFKNKYRSVDVLLIDDIQFLAGKVETQEAFFHTFNHLHQNNKQIVLSSDRPPKAIPTLENRLISRFEWGMIVDVGSPDLETRMAILKSKCLEKEFELDNEIITYISSNVHSNIRELEGALNQIIASTQLTGKKPDLESTKNILSSISKAPKQGALTAKQVLNTVSDYFDIKIPDLTGNCRKKELVVPRQIVMYLMREEMRSSYPNIGQELGGRDHTTAMHAYTKISKELEENEKLQQDIILIKQRIYNG
ncbi:MAG: chromosomal replication initiator protein DnaA [Patescibacteria group bacterium]